MNCPYCLLPAKHVAGQVHYCARCNNSILQRESRADVMQCGSCAAWLQNVRRGRGLCTESKSHKDETQAEETCAYWEAV